MKRVCVILAMMLPIVSWATKKKVLFLGNSYTAVNNLPQMVANLATNSGDTLIFDSYTPGGYTWQQHSTDATAKSKIAQGGWDFVVLQEQSQMPAFPQSQFSTDCAPYATRLDSLVHAASPCAETIFYMTWGRENGDASNCANYPPLCTYNGMDSLLQLRYTFLAQNNRALLAPVGKVWHKVRDLYYPGLQMYDTDGSHPTMAGSYIAASTFYTRIFKKNPTALTQYFTVPATQAQSILQVCKTLVYDSLGSYDFVDRTPPVISTFQFNFISATSLQIIPVVTGVKFYKWTLHDGTTSTQPTFTFNYSSGYLKVTLVASNCYGSDTLDYELQAIDPAYLAQINLYPNPGTQTLIISHASDIFDEVMVYDLQGKLLKTQSIKASNTIDMSSLPSGYYQIRLQNTQGQFYTLPWQKL